MRLPPCEPPSPGHDVCIRSKSTPGSCCPSICMRSGHDPTAMLAIHCDGRSSSDGSRRRSRPAKAAQNLAPPRESARSGNAGSGNIRCVMQTTSPGTSITSISIRLNTGLSRGQSIGRIPRSGEPSRGGNIQQIGRGRMVMSPGLERSIAIQRDLIGCSGDGGVLKSTPPYAG